MRKPEIESRGSPVFRRLKIRLFFFLVHTCPNRLTLLVYGNIVNLCPNEDREVPNTYRDKHFVASAIQWLVIVSVDVGADDVASLNTHVVQSGRYCASTNSSGISRGDGNKDRVDVRVADKKGGNDPA
jgi:hypothetical protein